MFVLFALLFLPGSTWQILFLNVSKQLRDTYIYRAFFVHQMVKLFFVSLILMPFMCPSMSNTKSDFSHQGEEFFCFCLHHVKHYFRDFPGGPVAETLPSNVRGMALIPDYGAVVPIA